MRTTKTKPDTPRERIRHALLENLEVSLGQHTDTHFFTAARADKAIVRNGHDVAVLLHAAPYHSVGGRRKPPGVEETERQQKARGRRRPREPHRRT